MSNLEADDKRLEAMRHYVIPNDPFQIADDISFLLRVIDQLNRNIDDYENDAKDESPRV